MLNLYITFIVVMVYDYLDFFREFLSRFYSVILHRKVSVDSIKLPKILECSLCATFWLTLAAQIITTGEFAIVYIVISLLWGISTPIMLSVINISVKFINLTLKTLNDLMNKI